MHLSQTANKLILAVLALAALFCGISIVFFDNINFCGGVLFSTIFVVIKLIVTEKSIQHAVNLDAKSADAYMKGQYALRYFLTGGVLIAAALIEPINLYGAIVGALLAQPAGYIVMFLEGRTGNKNVKNDVNNYIKYDTNNDDENSDSK